MRASPPIHATLLELYGIANLPRRKGTFFGLGVLARDAVIGTPRLTMNRGNRKIGQDAAIWSVLPVVSCPGMAICGLICYAFKTLKGLNGSSQPLS